MIRYYQEVGLLKAEEEELIAEMKPSYDNYCFSKSVVDIDPKMFNCDMVCYFLNRVMQIRGWQMERMDEISLL